MKNNPHNFYRPEDILYILENKKYWLSHYEFRSDGIYKKYNKNILYVDFNCGFMMNIFVHQLNI